MDILSVFPNAEIDEEFNWVKCEKPLIILEREYTTLNGTFTHDELKAIYEYREHYFPGGEYR